MAVELETLRKNIKLLRTVRGISQEELSDAIHLARTTYSAYEKGTKPIDLQTLDALSAIYNISLESLVNYDLSEGLFHRIYLMQENESLADLLNDYQGLSVASKALIVQQLDLLLKREEALYPDFSAAQKNITETKN